jgi:hypothetical protein
MTKLVVQPAARRYFKKLKDKQLKQLFRDAVAEVLADPEIGSQKSGDLSGIQCVDIFYQGTNYELAYCHIKPLADMPESLGGAKGETPEPVLVIIMAGTRENFYKELKRYMRDSG